MIETDMPSRAMFVVDWDGTCVEEIWPGDGEWLVGAVSALRWFSAMGKTVIYSLRCHRYEIDDVTLRPEGAADAEAARIRARLDEKGLHDIEVYPCDRGKPPGKFYIDDRGVRFQGDWDAVVEEVAERMGLAGVK